METYIALFRGINVGGRNILPMKELQSLLEKNACCNVKTYIQSGNVVFQCEKLPTKINLIIEEKYNFKPETLFITKKDFLQIVTDNPFNSAKGKEAHFYFCKDSPQPDKEKIEELRVQPEQYSLKNKVLYLYAPDGIGRSKLVARLEKLLGTAATGRNLNTINKLKELVLLYD